MTDIFSIQMAFDFFNNDSLQIVVVCGKCQVFNSKMRLYNAGFQHQIH